jgi:hypothetical protein
MVGQGGKKQATPRGGLVPRRGRSRGGRDVGERNRRNRSPGCGKREGGSGRRNARVAGHICVQPFGQAGFAPVRDTSERGLVDPGVCFGPDDPPVCGPRPAQRVGTKPSPARVQMDLAQLAEQLLFGDASRQGDRVPYPSEPPTSRETTQDLPYSGCNLGGAPGRSDQMDVVRHQARGDRMRPDEPEASPQPKGALRVDQGTLAGQGPSDDVDEREGHGLVFTRLSSSAGGTARLRHLQATCRQPLQTPASAEWRSRHWPFPRISCASPSLLVTVLAAVPAKERPARFVGQPSPEGAMSEGGDGWRGGGRRQPFGR